MSNEIKKILGLDLGTNSIGWALIERNDSNGTGKIIQAGTRILPMTQDIIGKFAEGSTISQTADRTKARTARRLLERKKLRRERLHRVLNILGWLPAHYAKCVDFTSRKGKFFAGKEPKLPFNDGKFLFEESFQEMLNEFKQYNPSMSESSLLPYDWTVYYLRKKALKEKISPTELAWLLLHFNQKRGYNQLRGEEEDESNTKIEEYHSLFIKDVKADDRANGKGEVWYNMELENGWIYRRSSRNPLFNLKGQTRDFIVSTECLEDGSPKADKDGTIKRTFRAPKEDDWTLIKKRTEKDLQNSRQTVGEYIYAHLLSNPGTKIKGGLIRTIERNFYKEELERILLKQAEFISDFTNSQILEKCILDLYPNNIPHQELLKGKNLQYLLLEDILFYQRPLKSQKDKIADCPLEKRYYKTEQGIKSESLKVCPKSHPVFQEFRIWQWLSNLRIIDRLEETDVTSSILQQEIIENLFEFLIQKKEIKQKDILRILKLKETQFRWNYPEDKSYPMNETFWLIKTRTEKIADFNSGLLATNFVEELWHILYSVQDKVQYEKALLSFAKKHSLNPEDFRIAFKKVPSFNEEYGAYSLKAIKKLLPLMRMGKYWSEDNIYPSIKQKIDKILNAEFDPEIPDRVRDKVKHLNSLTEFSGLPEWLAKYVVYGLHSESMENTIWTSPSDMEQFLKEFKQHSLRNPIAEQVILETLRVVKELWMHYGDNLPKPFDEIHIELSRDLKHTKDERKRLSEVQSRNESTNVRLKTLLLELSNDPTVEAVRPNSPMQLEALKIFEEYALAQASVSDDILKISRMANPGKAELQRYKLWLEQNYRSPYTGEIIPLSKLFTPQYDIEHIIPQKRFYDDSISNKVVCERAVNQAKDSMTGMEFIQSKGGSMLDIGFGKMVKIFKEEEYKDFVTTTYANLRSKKVKLLSRDIPEKMVERQLNDTRYISSYMMKVLSNIVRDKEQDSGMNSKNVIATNGKITTQLRNDWGLDVLWNELILPRFERLNNLVGPGFTVFNERHQKQLPAIPLDIEKTLGKPLSKKRIDHRHHALDALVIACTTRNHINLLNNINALDKRKSSDERQKLRNDLKTLLCKKLYQDEQKENYSWIFKQPWEGFVPEARTVFNNMLISFKSNTRVINKSGNRIEKWVDGDKKLVREQNGEHWSIRKSMHKATVSGKVSIRLKKTINLRSALEDPDMIVDRKVKFKVKELFKQNFDKKGIQKHLSEIQKLEVYYFDNELAASRTALSPAFTKEYIDCVTDSGIKKILLKHLDENENESERAFSPEGIVSTPKNQTI
jgi:CRISPR-associated endonuclease Csn1